MIYGTVLRAEYARYFTCSADDSRLGRDYCGLRTSIHNVVEILHSTLGVNQLAVNNGNISVHHCQIKAPGGCCVVDIHIVIEVQKLVRCEIGECNCEAASIAGEQASALVPPSQVLVSQNV
jgi:hypothetical protein